MAAGWFETTRAGDDVVLKAGGRWTLAASRALDAALRRLTIADARNVLFDLTDIEALDTAGAWLIKRTQLDLSAAGIAGTVRGAKAGHAALLARVSDVGAPPPLAPHPRFHLVDILEHLGEALFHGLRQARDLLNFFGALLFAAARVIRHPGRIRFISFVSHVQLHGLNAMPIIGILLFLVGIVVAYQGVGQLSRFGAQIYTVDLVGISVLREMGVLISSIVIAGRSGSAFTAQLGTMQVNEEIDAIRTMGLDPLEVLVLPRILALMIALPLLTFFADIMAILGGAFMSTLTIDITFAQFLSLLNQAVTLTHFWVGMVKAPIFALLIAMVGCFEGMRVRGSAESVGRLTTQAVVEALFLVIVVDAFFSVLFSFLGI
ncbi:MAG TPA: MlaE family lipid ABC transporter permease subunit [Methylomirabilota bacterium]|nr:MlaE family lipid ABC transporter permease subunit [Methylomirabilota bacterium]